MKKILFINTVNGIGSTGRICTDLYEIAEKNGYQCCIGYGRYNSSKEHQSIKIGNKFSLAVHLLLSRIFDMQGLASKWTTKKFLKEIESYKPDIIHLHNIHGYYINYKLLFDFLNINDSIKIVWTLHDCWTYTGHCAYYLANECYKWHKGCFECQFNSSYPKSYFDRSNKNFQNKRTSFCSLIDRLNIVSVSEWLNTELNNSFLKNASKRVITNGIDTDVFHYRKSDFKKKFNLEDKIIILGVAQNWTEKKGLTDFLELCKKLDDSYKIVLVGLSRKQIHSITKDIICIERTNSIEALAELYSAADVFFNPTKEETYGLTNIEAQCCGTAVVSYDSGGTSETLFNHNSYLVNDINDFISLLNSEQIDYKKAVPTVSFDKKIKMMEYIELYNKLTKEDS